MFEDLKPNIALLVAKILNGEKLHRGFPHKSFVVPMEDLGLLSRQDLLDLLSVCESAQSVLSHYECELLEMIADLDSRIIVASSDAELMDTSKIEKLVISRKRVQAFHTWASVHRNLFLDYRYSIQRRLS